MATPPTTSYTLRLTFAYKGRQIRLVGSQRVAMMAPPAVTPAPEKDQSGTWIEVRDASGALLFHRALHDPVRSDVEVHHSPHSRDSRHSMTRQAIPSPEGRFEVLVPDLPDARSFVLYGEPADTRSPHPPSRELLSFDFDELRKPRTDQPDPSRPI